MFYGNGISQGRVVIRRGFVAMEWGFKNWKILVSFLILTITIFDDLISQSCDP